MFGSVALTFGCYQPARAQATLVHVFQHLVLGAAPQGPLISDPSGSLYGVTESGGSFNKGIVYRLSRTSASAPWTETVLYNFAGHGDGVYPTYALARDSTGALYGVTLGSPSGIYKLTPPGVGQTVWTKTWLALVNDISSGPVFGSDGTLYFTTKDLLLKDGYDRYGAIYELSPPPAGQTAWTQTLLYQFTGGADGTGPAGNLLVGKAGNLIGTAVSGGGRSPPCDPFGGCGTVFKLARPKPGETAWRFALLYSFSGIDGANPMTGVVSNADNTVLYGTTAYSALTRAGRTAGTVFELTPPASGIGPWQHQTIHQLVGGYAYYPSGVVLDSAGRVVGGQEIDGPAPGSVHGIYYSLLPPGSSSGSWSETDFTLTAEQGFDPTGILIGIDGTLYGTNGGSMNYGTVVRLAFPEQ